MKPFHAFLVLLCAVAVPARAQDSAPDSTGLPADSARIYELAEVEQPPRPANLAELRDSMAATYPAERLAARASGTVLVSFVVAPDGSTHGARVLTSSDSAFDAPTVAAVRGLRFSPARLADRAVPVRAQMNIQWQPPAPVAGQGVVTGAARTEDGERVYTMNRVVADGGREYEMGEVEVAPRPINLAAFRRVLERTYPAHLRGTRSQGTVSVRMLVDTAGVPRNPRILQSTQPEFNQATLESVVQLRFRPARVDGKPVNAWVELPIQWTISDPSPTAPRRP